MTWWEPEFSIWERFLATWPFRYLNIPWVGIPVAVFILTGGYLWLPALIFGWRL